MCHLHGRDCSSSRDKQELEHGSNVNPVLLVPNFPTMPSNIKSAINGVNQNGYQWETCWGISQMYNLHGTIGTVLGGLAAKCSNKKNFILVTTV